MSLSHRVRPWALAVGLLSASSLARADVAATSSAQLAVDYTFLDQLEARIQKLLPTLLSSLSAVRRERDTQLVRCFDRAVSELHSISRQVAYHGDRLEDEHPAERARHDKALRVLSARVDALATTRIGCFTEGAVVKPGQTAVEVVYR